MCTWCAGKELRDKFCLNDLGAGKYLCWIFQVPWILQLLKFSSLWNLYHQCCCPVSVLSLTMGPSCGGGLSPANGYLLNCGHGVLNPAQIRIICKLCRGGMDSRYFYCLCSFVIQFRAGCSGHGDKSENTITEFVLGQCPIVSPLVNQLPIKKIKN